ncbi:hypothetical protein ACSQ76_02940 [Roseovarius sp. B08]|uniref:hypothetical protein n=1 Tax=Roseovarius sp. B08 TaxID=3449223 RepID=UPI003EDB7DD2
MTAIGKAALTVLLALFIAIRVVAQPTILAAPESGVMALCSGGQIVYVSMDTGQPVDTGDDTGLAADPCPFFGVTAFDINTQKQLAPPAVVPTALNVFAASATFPIPGASVQNAARAPPLPA